MKNLKLSNTEKTVIVDDEDYHYLSRFNWCLAVVEGLEIVRRVILTKKGRTVLYLHDAIVPRPMAQEHKSGFNVLFRNGNRMDFRKENIDFDKTVSLTQRARKMKLYKGKEPSSIYKGVTLQKYTHGKLLEKPMWRAQIEQGKRKTPEYIRYVKTGFETEVEAAKWYNEKALLLYGQNAYQNKIV